MKVIGSFAHKNNVYELRDYGSWQAIVKTVQDNVSLKNEWGGYPVLHTGAPKYIQGLWKAMRKKGS